MPATDARTVDHLIGRVQEAAASERGATWVADETDFLQRIDTWLSLARQAFAD